MPTQRIPIDQTGYFSPLILDYLARKPELEPFYGHFPTIENFGDQIAQKQFPIQNRGILAEALRRQYSNLSPSLDTMANIAALESANTFTVTTGHQLNLFTGPLYFAIKILDTIALSRKLAVQYPKNHFVPVYWMATEDHDFDEIDHFYFREEKIQWKHPAGGPVGRLDNAGLEDVIARFAAKLGPGDNAERLRNLFTDAYRHDTLAAATRYLANELFGKFGLVIIDGDDRELKKLFAPMLQKELETSFSNTAVQETSSKLGYPSQVHPRDINLFYMSGGMRERIIRTDDGFSVLNSDIEFSTTSVANEVMENPDRFSPNVVLRPLYQECILPNLSYIGGGGEIAYWLQLKAMFDRAGVAFPILMLRNSIMIAQEKHDKKRKSLGLDWADLFGTEESLSAIITQKHSELQLDFEPMKKTLENQFDSLLAIATKTHPSFLGAVKAQQTRQLKGLINLEKRLLKAEKKNHNELINRALALRSELFPGGSLQERKANFSEFYLLLGDGLFDALIDELNPLEPHLRIMTI